MRRWLLVSIAKKIKNEGFGGIQMHRERERNRSEKGRRKGGELREEMTGNGVRRLLSSGIFDSSSQPQV
jgi:hypothetical protein